MPEINEVKIRQILNPTSIDLGEYVINPFMGCEFACLYCYVRSNRVVSRKNKPWGQYLDIRVNAPELLEREIEAKKPKTVLLGSTTECFQPAEKEYRLTKSILEVLNRNKIFYVILTRSPDILDHLPLLASGFCKTIYFTVNNFADGFKSRLEPQSPGFSARVRAINTLLNAGVPVIPYFSPVLPWVSDISGVFMEFKKAERVEFECLNFSLKNIREIIDNIAMREPSLKVKYERMLDDVSFYQETWEAIKADIAKQAKEAGKKYNIYIHSFGDYFKNTYKKEKT